MGEVPEEFLIIMEGVQGFLLPVTLETENENSFESEWPPGGPWHEKENSMKRDTLKLLSFFGLLKMSDILPIYGISHN